MTVYSTCNESFRVERSSARCLPDKGQRANEGSRGPVAVRTKVGWVFSSLNTHWVPATAVLSSPQEAQRAARPLLIAMDDVHDHYPVPDPYARRRLDRGIDSKIVVMGSSGASRDRRPPRPYLILLPQASGRPVCCSATPKTSSIPGTPRPPAGRFSSPRR